MEMNKIDDLNLWEDIPMTIKDGLIPTLNKMGYMTTFLDPYSEKFIDYAAICRKQVLEIGSAYGVASLQALVKGATVLSNDLDPNHLRILEKRCPKVYRDRLNTIAGNFIEIELPLNHFGAILAVRVLHFMDGDILRKTLSYCYDILQKEAKLFIVADTPYMKDWQSFIPIFEQRLQDQVEWPGLIEDVSRFESTRICQIPKLIHWLDEATLRRELTLAKFEIEEMAYLNRKDYPTDVRLDGRESIGAIAIKKG